MTPIYHCNRYLTLDKGRLTQTPEPVSKHAFMQRLFNALDSFDPAPPYSIKREGNRDETVFLHGEPVVIMGQDMTSIDKTIVLWSKWGLEHTYQFILKSCE